jgi:tetratricopeptide (TPR) repeat protein
VEKQPNELESGVKRVWPRVMSWIGGVTAVIGLFASIGGGITWVRNHHKDNAERRAKIALAETQEKQGEYQESIESYGEILKGDPLDPDALDRQLNVAMLWAENFHVLVPDGQSPTAAAGPELDQIMGILDAGLARTKSARAADIQAHIGWTHWLNQHIAEREFGDAAEKNLHAALETDPSNVYANAMLGNWMLQNNRDFTQAVQHLDAAVSTGKARPFVRKLQIGGLNHLDRPGARGALVKAANDMRKAGEPLDPSYKSDILAFCFNPTFAGHQDLAESLSAAPPGEIGTTYLWLDQDSGDDHRAEHEFVNASLMEVQGKRQESLEKYRELRNELKNQPGSLREAVDASVARLSRSSG